MKSILKAVFSALMTEKFIKELVIYFLEKLTKKTTNSIDDDVVAKVKKALEVE